MARRTGTGPHLRLRARATRRWGLEPVAPRSELEPESSRALCPAATRRAGRLAGIDRGVPGLFDLAGAWRHHRRVEGEASMKTRRRTATSFLTEEILVPDCRARLTSE